MLIKLIKPLNKVLILPLIRPALTVMVWIGFTFLLFACTYNQFSLRSEFKYLPFKYLMIQSQANSLLFQDISIALKQQGVQVFKASQSNVSKFPLLVLSDENREKIVLSINATGRVREYQLRQSVTIQVFDENKHILLDTIKLSKQKDFTYTDHLVLAKEIEEANIYQTIQYELKQTLLNRLSALSALIYSNNINNTTQSYK